MAHFTSSGLFILVRAASAAALAAARLAAIGGMSDTGMPPLPHRA